MNKFERAQTLLQNFSMDGWLIACNEDSDVHSRFMLGVESHARHYIYIDAKGNHHIIATEMEAPMIKKSLDQKGIEAEVNSYAKAELIPEILAPLISEKKIALNYGEDLFGPDSTVYADYITLGEYFTLKDLVPKSNFVSAAPIINELRSVKSSENLKDLRNVCQATLEILESLPDWVKVGMTEKEVKAKLEYEYMKQGEIAFGTIVASNENAADPHHNTSEKKIEPGVLLIDSGMKIDEMCSDITWTYWVQGEPTEKFLNAYNALYESKKEANKSYVDGALNNQPAKSCREKLSEYGYDHEKLFYHGLGHALGFQPHDVGARVSWKVSDDYKLRENMVYTNEPGLYWQGEFGIRLEDDLIVGKEKCEQVTYNPKDPLVI
ncbi:MAG: Xaa-Pro dipeptidase [Promethearchaeota archaeon]|nr:MAG: Xaa-Pro dipeptidase [Candidatus Lokiarchaeota archaeon]